SPCCGLWPRCRSQEQRSQEAAKLRRSYRQRLAELAGGLHAAYAAVPFNARTAELNQHLVLAQWAAQVAMRRLRFDEAQEWIALFERVRAANPPSSKHPLYDLHSDSHALKAELAQRKGDYAGAVKEWREALRARPRVALLSGTLI